LRTKYIPLTGENQVHRRDAEAPRNRGEKAESKPESAELAESAEKSRQPGDRLELDAEARSTRATREEEILRPRHRGAEGRAESKPESARDGSTPAAESAEKSRQEAACGCGNEFRKSWTRLRLAAVALALCAGVACRQDMHDQPKFIPLRPSEFFDDGRSERPLIEGTVARGHLDDDAAFYTGKGPDGKPLDTFPFPVTRDVILRGQDRFNIYCSPCHGRTGSGDGTIVRRGYRRPPSYHTDKIRELQNGFIFDVITNGFGAMPDYAAQIPPHDRCAIVAYVRALQLSENATMNDVPPADRSQLTSGGAR
jgi:hypothetical protein